VIIKKKDAGASPSTMEAAPAALPQSPAWTPETIMAGLVPERRAVSRDTDRRRGYRRIEDRELISKAHEEANAIREAAQREGFREGLAQAAKVIEELRQIITENMSLRETALESVTGDIAGLAVEVAARVIKTEVSCDDTLVMALVRETIRKSGQKSGQAGGRGMKSILIKVNPDDVATVKATLKDEPIPNLNAELIVMAEPTVDAGSCILETDSGLIDASFTTQLEILHQLFGSRTDQHAS
jgi:flagellar biosynthesis/type III secretory pathway protein FliH